MVLSKALKAKHSSIPSEVTSLSMPGLNWLSRKTAVAVPLFNHPLWRQLGPSQMVSGACVVCVELWLLSLSLSLSLWWEVGLPPALWQELGPNFR